MERFKEPLTFGPYHLFAKVAQGGMAEVFLATSTKADLQGQFLAIKKLHQHLNSNKAFVNLLIHEAKVSVLLNHPSIASVYDLGNYKSEFFLAMEYVHGKSLDRILERINEGKASALPIEVATYIIMETLRSLAFAHSLKDVKGRDLNIIHRDISPGNILLEYKGEVKLTDFGLATAESRLQPEFSNTPMGKLIYMSPEQIINDPVVRASDLYSLGVVFYELLTGQHPFQADSASSLYRKIIDGQLIDMKVTAPKSSQRLQEMIHVCLHKSTRKRFQSAPEMFQAFNQYFIEEYDLDFNSRSVRNYYKKKLSEYLRNVFQQEMVEELQIIQEALQQEQEDEALKATAPQQIPQDIEKKPQHLDEISDVDDQTVFEQDHTDEATRHYPLSQKERENIIKGIPPKEALSDSMEDASQPADYELATVPGYDFSSESSEFRGISVVKRLEETTLKADEKETLKRQMPSMEITSQEELENFEESTFSGSKKNDENSVKTKSSKSGNDMLEEVEYARKQTSSSQKSPIGRIKPKTNPVTRTSKIIPKQVNSSFWTVLVGSGLFIISVTFFLWAFPPPTWKLPTGHPPMLPTQSIFLSLLGEAPSEDQEQFYASITQADSEHSLRRLSEFFQDEYSRYTGDDTSPIEIISNEPETVSTALSEQSRVTQLLHHRDIFEFFRGMGYHAREAQDRTVLVYLYPHRSTSGVESVYPKDFRGSRPTNTGIVFAEAHSNPDFSFFTSLAREIAVLYGASLKYDRRTYLPETPEGLADPNKYPLYPQEQGELMARSIAHNVLERRPIRSFDEMIIGPVTAYELGWIDAEQREELLAGQ